MNDALKSFLFCCNLSVGGDAASITFYVLPGFPKRIEHKRESD